MQLPLIEPGNIYTHTGNYFSKLFLLEETRKKTERSLLIIVTQQKQLKKYLSLAEALHIKLQKLKELQDIDDIWSVCQDSQLWIIEESEMLRLIPEKFQEHGLNLEVWKEYSMEQIIWEIVELWYEYGEFDAPGSYIKKWDTVSITKDSGHKIELRFFWDELEEIIMQEIKLPELQLYSRKEFEIDTESKHIQYISLEELLKNAENLHIVWDNLLSQSREKYFELYKNYSSLDILWEYNTQRNTIKLAYHHPVCKSLEELKKLFWNSDISWYIYTKHKKYLSEFLSLNQLHHITLKSLEHTLSESFSFGNTYVICDDILNGLFIRKRSKKKLSQDIDLLLKIQEDDYVVHIDHGIGIYKWITKKELPSENWGLLIKEYLEIHYEKDEKLFVPISELSRVSKYVWGDSPKLHPLKWKSWQKKITKVREDIEEIAWELLKTFAERKLRSGERLDYDTEKLDQFIASFPYSYTEDQTQAIKDILGDMNSDKNMDRLIVGDVWFWKTELAFIAAYAAVLAGKQAVFISPLVVLAHEHYYKAIERFLGLGLKIEIMTRLQSQREITQTLKNLKSWDVDIVIGTHRLLSDDIVYKNLWILIVDEEHKFGVQDKERIKKIRSNIDILSLSATPIPRSLNLALSGIRDISLLKIPPHGRKAIETYVSRYNIDLIRDAGKREFARWGQVFFIHNRVTTLEVYKQELEKIFPRKKIIVVHGQLPWDELEDRIIAFKERKYDILLSTTVIENGIDFSNVNTIFINECQQFGISQIHQLRGRVGRSDEQAYCYLLYKKQELDIESAKRIQTIVDYSYLGAGFELAMKDLEIRWWGDILWVRQSGQGKEIGMSLFLKLLEEKIEQLKHWDQMQEKIGKTYIDLQLNTYVPEEYFLSEADKLNFYREIESIENLEDIEVLKESMLWDADKDDSQALRNIFLLAEVAQRGKQYMIAQIKKVGKHYTLDFHSGVSFEMISTILKRDYEMYFQVVNSERLRAEIKHFTSPKIFIQYVLDILKSQYTKNWQKILRKSG